MPVSIVLQFADKV